MQAEDAFSCPTSVLGEPDAELMTEINMGLPCKVSSGVIVSLLEFPVPLSNGQNNNVWAENSVGSRAWNQRLNTH